MNGTCLALRTKRYATVLFREFFKTLKELGLPRMPYLLGLQFGLK